MTIAVSSTADDTPGLRAKIEQMFPGITIVGSGPGTEQGTTRFHVIHPSGDRHYAMQFYPLPKDDPNLATRFEAASYRVQAMQAVKHPNLDMIIHFAQVDQHAVLITEWNDGQTLEARLNSGPVELDQALAWMMDISEGLNRLHLFGLAHGGLRPSHVWVTPQGRAIVGGFGLAEVLHGKRTQDLQESLYAAPEVRYSSLLPDDPRCDIFSLGVVSYRILTGNLPSGQFIERPSKKHNTGAWLDQLVLKAMNHGPDQRHQSIQSFQGDMQSRFLSEVEWAPAPEEEYKPRKRFWRAEDGSMSRMVWVFSGIAVAAVCLSLWLGGMVQTRQKELQLSYADSLALMIESASLIKAGRADEAKKLLASASKLSPEERAKAAQEVMDRLMKEGRYDEALQLAELYLEACGGASDSKNGPLNRVVQRYSQRINEFLSLTKQAERERKGENFMEEKKALEKALALMPDDERIRRLLAKNPLIFDAEFRLLQARLAQLNPRQKEWHMSYHADADGIELDLSDHLQLVDISPLTKPGPSEIDLRWTGVRSLEYLSATDITGLYLDYAPVEDFQPLVKVPLTHFSFPGTPVKSLAIMAKMTALKSVRGRPGEAQHLRIPRPRPGAKWDNSLGQRLRPADNPRRLYAIWETRKIDYAPYIAEKNTRGSEKEAGQLRLDPLTPITNVTVEEAAEFCQWLTMRELRLGVLQGSEHYRLPTLEESKAFAKWTKSSWALSEISPAAAAPAPVEPLEKPEAAPGVPEAKPAPPPINKVARKNPTRGFFDVETNAPEWWTNDADLFNPSTLAMIRARAAVAKAAATGRAKSAKGGSKSANPEAPQESDSAPTAGFRVMLDLGKGRS